ncbi:MAG: diguanylate cyclase [Actinobacteria bacterium]|nr:diguanylate cyclase [Actinomycetota bacterium]
MARPPERVTRLPPRGGFCRPGDPLAGAARSLRQGRDGRDGARGCVGLETGRCPGGHPRRDVKRGATLRKRAVPASLAYVFPHWTACGADVSTVQVFMSGWQWKARVSGSRSGLPWAVAAVSVLLFVATAAAGTASVQVVTEQDRLLQQESQISAVVAEAGRAQALVAGLADPRTNPARVPGMRAALEESALRISERATAWQLRGQDEIVAQAAPLLGTLTSDFADEATKAADPDSDLRPGQLIRGSLDGIYPVLRSQGDTARAAMVTRANAGRAQWARAVALVLAVAFAAAASLTFLMFGPVRRRLARQRSDAARLAAARDSALNQLRAILDSLDTPVVTVDSAGRWATGNQAAQRLFPSLAFGRASVRAFHAAAQLRTAEESLGPTSFPPSTDTNLSESPLEITLRTGDAVTRDVLIHPSQPARAGALRAGAARPARYTVRTHLVTDADGHQVGAVATFQDITDLYDRTEHLAQHASHLTAIGRATTAVLRHDDARSAVCEAARDVVSAELATLFEDDGHGDLVCTAAAGADVFGMRLPISSRSMTASVFATARARTTLAVDQEPDIDGNAVTTLSRACGRPLTAGVWIPVVSGGRCRAVLAIGFSAPVDFDRHLATLEIIADEAAVALDRQDLMRRLATDAESDPLTGAANRRAWDTALPSAVYTARATGSTVSLVMLDLDHFKTYNDTHGHPAGDTLLRQTVAAWRNQLRPGDTLARYGGEEFAVLLPQCDLNTAARVADSLRQLVPGGQTCSAGVAELQPGEDPEDLLARADQALYTSKHAGRDRTTSAPPPPAQGHHIPRSEAPGPLNT